MPPASGAIGWGWNTGESMVVLAVLAACAAVSFRLFRWECRAPGRSTLRPRSRLGYPRTMDGGSLHDREPRPLPGYSARNRAFWEEVSDEYQAENGPFLARKAGLAWGIWQIPEAELQVLGDVDSRDVLELGCGAAQWAIALAKRGARMVGLDLSARQLEHARRAMAAAGVSFPLIHAGAESVPLPDRSFDLVFCDWGAMHFADPARTLPEVARLLRPGGLLAFNGGTPLYEMCWVTGHEHAGDRLLRDYFGLYSVDDGETIEFIPTYGEWIRLFCRHGFLVEDLIELRPPADAVSTYRDEVDHAWSRRWPMEQIWRVRREG